MREKASQIEINEAIQALIEAVKKGKNPERPIADKISLVFLREQKAKKKSHRMFFKHCDISVSPQGYLLDALEQGMIAKSEHRKFVSQMETFLRIENSLLAVSHIYPDQFQEFVDGYYGKPIQHRIEKLTRLSGINFQEIIDLNTKHTLMLYKVYHAQGRAGEERIRYLKEQARRLEMLLEQKTKQAMAEIKNRLQYRFAQPNTRQRLLEALRNKRDELSKRDLEKLQKTLEAFDSWKAKKKTIPNRRILR